MTSKKLSKHLGLGGLSNTSLQQLVRTNEPALYYKVGYISQNFTVENCLFSCVKSVSELICSLSGVNYTTKKNSRKALASTSILT